MTLVERIIGDLRFRLARGEDPDLRIEALAAQHGTSTRPVRLALSALADDGVIVRDGRLWQVAARPRKTAAPAPTPVHDARGQLLDLLVRRSLAGDASFLREEETAAVLGLGRTALRAQLAQLSGQGLVVHEPRRGWRARTLDQADLNAFLHVRERLELLALDLAFARVDPVRIRRFLAANRPTADGIDNDLHGYLIGLAGNPYIDDFFSRHGAYFTMLFRWEGQDAAAAAAARTQHRAILSAILAQDAAAAHAALSHHIRSSHPVLAALMPPGG